MAVTGVAAQAAVGQVGVVADSHHGDSESIDYSSPEGIRSASTLGPGGVRLEMRGTAGLGRPGDPRVIELLVNLIRAEGRSVTVQPGTDSDGEDGVLQLDGTRVFVQCVSAPLAQDFYRAASAGSAATSGDLELARDWVSGAIDQKAQRYGPDFKASTILGIDVRHVGVLVSAVAINSGLRNRAAAAGFLGVGLIGPHSSRVTWLTDPPYGRVGLTNLSPLPTSE